MWVASLRVCPFPITPRFIKANCSCPAPARCWLLLVQSCGRTSFDRPPPFMSIIWNLAEQIRSIDELVVFLMDWFDRSITSWENNSLFSWTWGRQGRGKQYSTCLEAWTAWIQRFQTGSSRSRRHTEVRRQTDIRAGRQADRHAAQNKCKCVCIYTSICTLII
jgi:hypothetical protein